MRTSAAADLLQAEQLGGGLGLIFAVMFEWSLGKESQWSATLLHLALCPGKAYVAHSKHLQ